MKAYKIFNLYMQEWHNVESSTGASGWRFHLYINEARIDVWIREIIAISRN